MLRAATGKRLSSRYKENFVEKEIKYHLRMLSRELQAGTVDESDLENADETHFIINMGNGKTFGFVGGKAVKHST